MGLQEGRAKILKIVSQAPTLGLKKISRKVSLFFLRPMNKSKGAKISRGLKSVKEPI